MSQFRKNLQSIRAKTPTPNASKQPFSTDAIEVMGEVGDAGFDIQSARAKYIQEKAIQRKAPVPKSVKGTGMDSQCTGQVYNAQFDYVNQHLLSYFIASSSFIGYQAMALIAQHWLIMKGCSQKAKDAMRNGFEPTRNDGVNLKPEQLAKIKKLDKKYRLHANQIQGVTFNNVFGIRHILYKNTDPNFDYSKPFSPSDFMDGKYAGIAQVDPYWITPEFADEDLSDPTQINFYEPTYWLIQGKRYHKSHFKILMGEEVPDYLKPTYRYGGISLAQKVYERVYAGERTANEMPQLAMTKRVMNLFTNLEKAQSNKSQFVKNLAFFSEMMNNNGVRVGGKDDRFEISDTSLTDLDSTMWAQYHLVSSIFDVPVSKLYGTGHDGFSTGETDEDYYIASLETLQSTDLEEIAEGHYDRLIPSEMNEENFLDISWNPMKVLSEKEIADINESKSRTDRAYWDMNAIGEVDVRERLAADPNSGYSGIEMPEIEEDEEDSQFEDSVMDSSAMDYVREEDGEWFVFSKEGKRLSSGYQSKEDAEERLGQIEYFKHASDSVLDEKSCVDQMCKDERVEDAEYQGKPVELNKPFSNKEGSSKYAVYVRNDKGNVVKVNFGDPDMEIRRDNPEARKSFRDRHNCSEKTDRTKPGYWSCKFWSTKSVSELLGD